MMYFTGNMAINTYRHTYRPSDEAGSRGAFAPKKHNERLKVEDLKHIQSSTIPFIVQLTYQYHYVISLHSVFSDKTWTILSIVHEIYI